VIFDFRFSIFEGDLFEMNELEFKRRTMQFAIDSFALIGELPTTQVGRTVARQLSRCAPSVGANYRSACRARSRPDMISKLGIVEEEADESGYWLELIEMAGLLPSGRVDNLLKESNEFVAMTVSSRRRLKDK
jgi:four helix bundle protein